MLPAVGDDAAPALPTLVPDVVAAGIGSTNDKVRSAATDAADALIENVTATLLVQHVCTASRTAPRGEAALIGYLAILVEAVFPTRPQLVQKLRAAGGDGDADEREGTGDARGEREAAEGVGAVRRERGAVESRRGEIRADEGQAGGRAQEQGTLREGVRRERGASRVRCLASR